MRLMNVRDAGGKDTCVVSDGDRIVDVTAAEGVPGLDVLAFLGRPDWRTVAEAALARHGRPAEGGLPDRSRLGPVVTRPRNVIVAGANTRSHLAEAAVYTGAAPPRRPMVLAKSPNTVNGPYDDIRYPPETDSLDYEGELGVVVGQRIHRASEAEVNRAIAGFTIVNDVSARDFQLSSWEDNTFYRTHFLGKSFDGFCPCGPVIVTPDEWGDADTKTLRTWVNGELRQEATLDDLYFPANHLVSYVSHVLTLEPGDVVLTGSPAGVGAFHEKGYLKPGDVVRCAIDGIGEIENRIVRA